MDGIFYSADNSKNCCNSTATKTRQIQNCQSFLMFIFLKFGQSVNSSSNWVFVESLFPWNLSKDHRY
jgi:hypothetical protein